LQTHQGKPPTQLTEHRLLPGPEQLMRLNVIGCGNPRTMVEFPPNAGP
jgi:hypothetical protein